MSQFRCPTPSIQRWKAETHLEVIDVYVRPREPFCELCKGPSYCPAPTLSDFVGYKVAVFAPFEHKDCCYGKLPSSFEDSGVSRNQCDD